MNRIQNLGFTLIEILVSLSILVIIAGIAVTAFQDFARFQRYEQSVAELTSLIEESRTDARSAVDELNHGVKIFSSSLVQFTGSSYVGGSPSNITTNFNSVTLIPDFPGGVSEIVFSQLTAIPSATGTIDIVNPDIPATTTIAITAAGVIQY